jgi:hypothetical protein
METNTCKVPQQGSRAPHFDETERCGARHKPQQRGLNQPRSQVRQRLRHLFIFLALCAPSHAACTLYWVGGGSSTAWDATGSTNWSATSGGSNGAGPPGGSDDVCFDNHSGSGTAAIVSSSNFIHGIDTTGYIGTITHANGAALFVQGGSIHFTNTFTYTAAGSGAVIELYVSSSAQTVDTGGRSLGELAVADFGTGSYSLTSSLSAQALVIQQGSFSSGANTLNVGTIDYSGTNTRTVNFNGSAINVTGNGNLWVATPSTGLTFTATGSTITLTDTGTNKHFDTGGLTYNNLTIVGAPPGTIATALTGAGTFNTLTVQPWGLLVLPASTTTTVTAFSAVGASGQTIGVVSSTGGTAATLSQASGTVCSDYLSLQDVAAIGGAVWHAGSHSTNVSGNSGWAFTSCGSAFVSNPFIIYPENR